MPDLTVAAAAGASWFGAVAGLTAKVRTLYLYANRGIQDHPLAARALYLDANRGLWAISVLQRALYLDANRQIEALTMLRRSLYLHETKRDSEVSPWLMRLSPVEQYPGGQVDLFGDGLGEIVEVGQAATITASSTSGGNVPGNVVDRTTAEWISTSGLGAWLRFTFGSPKVVVGIALQDRTNNPPWENRWGVPLFRFSAGDDVIGGEAVSYPDNSSAEVPVGGIRTLYPLPAPRTCDWVEVRVSSGGQGTNRGLSEAWVFADQDQAAETSEALLGIDLMGIVAWSNRSPGLYPANSGQPITKAATVTVPSEAQSGMVIVREST